VKRRCTMKRVSAVMIGVVAAVALIGFWTADLAAKKPSPKSVTIENKNGAVTFPHEQHQKDIKCETCHHAKDPDKVACRACHTDQADGKRLTAKDAFHKTCRGCHDQKVKADPNSKAPTKCKDCHKK